jgi:hypothetical protein
VLARIYNLPENKLGKNALALARDILEGTKGILPDGHIPNNQQQADQMGDQGNWDNYPYLKKIKVSRLVFRLIFVLVGINYSEY